MAAAPLRIPVVLWEGNAIPGRSVRATARLADALAVSYEAAGRALAAAARPDVRDRDADPRRRPRSTGRRPGERLDLPPDAPVILIFGGSQAVRRFNAAVAEALPRLVDRVHVLHVTRRDGLCRGARGARAAAGRAARPLPAVPVPARRHARRPRRDGSRRRPGRLLDRSPRSPPSGSRRSSSRIPTPRGHQGANAEILAAAGRGPDRRRRGVRRRRARRRDRDPVRRAGPGRDGRGGPRPRPAGRRGRGRRRSSSPSPIGSRCRPPTAIDAIARGSGRDDRAGRRMRRARARAAVRPARDRDRDPAPDRGQDVARRAARRGSRRCGSAARRTCSRRSTTSTSCGRSSGSPGRAAIPLTLLGRGSDVVIADAGHPRPRRPEPGRGLAGRGRPVRRRVGPADGPRGDRDADGRPDRPGVRARDPGHGRRRGLGQRRRPRRRRRRRSSSRPTSCSADGTRGPPDGRRARLPLPRQPPEAPARTRSSSRRRSAWRPPTRT